MSLNNSKLISQRQLQSDKYEVPLRTQKFILQMCWAQHDGQWFLKTKKEFGIEKSNNLNKDVIRSMGKIETRHVMNALGIHKGDIKSIPECFKLLNTLMDVLIPNVMKFKFYTESNDEGLAIVEKCFIWKEVQKSKKENEYICACNSRHKGWLEAIGVNGKITPLKRISEGGSTCEFRFRLS